MPTPDYNVDLDLGEPPPELQEYARLQCGEDPNTKLQAIYELRDMIYERGECTPHRMDDEYLLRFLRARNFIPQRAHRLMVNYYQFKEDYPELFENVYPLDLRRLGDANVMAVPPYRDQNGRRLLLYRIEDRSKQSISTTMPTREKRKRYLVSLSLSFICLQISIGDLGDLLSGCWEPKSVPMEDILKATIFALELGLLEQRTQILGGVALFDLEDLGTQHAWQITPSVASKIVKLLVSSFPATTHAIHVINHSWIFDKMYNIFKPLLTSQMRSRIYFHGYDNTSLHKHIQSDSLPERYGGIWPDYPYTIWLDSLKKNYTVAKEVLASGYKFREEEICPEVVRKLKEEGIKMS